MTNEEKGMVFEVLQGLGDLYTTGISERKLMAYTDHLSDLPFLAVKKALKAAPKKFTRFPSAGELRALCDPNGGTGGVPDWKATKAYLKSVYGEGYYEKDYAEGVALGINRPVSEVVADEIERGWRPPASIAEARQMVHDVFWSDEPPREPPQDRVTPHPEAKEKLREIFQQLDMRFDTKLVDTGTVDCDEF